MSLRPTRAAIVVELDLPEAAALISGLAVLGPSVSDSAASAMRKLAAAVDPGVSVQDGPVRAPGGGRQGPARSAGPR
ncbi:MAG: hypothetical protein L0I76_12315 [Pseudonocardia sp.]|nr:hypothetical protein [Pseudonocardia sp.]